MNFTDSTTGKPIRPGFADVQHMNEYMIEKWNSVVKQGDVVYHLGDVVMGDKNWMHKNFNRLNGSKQLIVGNHDDIKFLASGGWFKKIHFWRKFHELGMLMSHVPIHTTMSSTGSPSNPQFLVNVHGHIHQNPSPPGLYINVSVEAIDYTPVHIETLAEQAKGMLNK